MKVRQQIHSALLLIIFASIACTIRMPENMARYATPRPSELAEPSVVQPANPGVIVTPVISNAIELTTPEVEPSLTPPAVALIEPPSTPSTIGIEPPVPAALAELTVDSLVKEAQFATTIPTETINQLQAKF